MTSDQKTSRDASSELKEIREALSKLAAEQKKLLERLSELTTMINGFTNGGASFSAYQVDAMTTAYLLILAPAIGQALTESSQKDINEMMKGATIFARRILEELAAYRSTREGMDYLEQQMAACEDPWRM